jgi:transposase
MKKDSISVGPRRVRTRIQKRRFTIGMDLGDRSSRYCLLDERELSAGLHETCRA